MNQNYDYLMKIVLIGPSGCGKTNVMSKLGRNQFDLESLPTVGVEFCQRDVVIEANVLRLQIWDTAGQEKYQSLTASYFRNASGVFLLYEISKKESFDQIQICKQYTGQYTQLFLVGNKSDLHNLREVPKAMAQQFAQNNGMLFGECSAATGDNLEPLLIEMVRNIYQTMTSGDVFIDNPAGRISLSCKTPMNQQEQVNQSSCCA